MKLLSLTLTIVLLCGCVSGAKDSGLTERYPVRVVRYFEADGSLPENRVIQCGDTLFHSVGELVTLIEAIPAPRRPTFTIENVGTCDPKDPRFSEQEIEAIRGACAHRGFDCILRLEKPNQPPEPTALLVTPRADARFAPSNAVAHL